VDEYRVIITPRAGADIQGIHMHIAQNSPTNAARMVARILDAIEPLRVLPHRAVAEHVSPRLRHPVRSLVVGPYIVYFRVLDEERTVRILHVRHGARRRPRRVE
jgi:plasmid stabilization system protein ParE